MTIRQLIGSKLILLTVVPAAGVLLSGSPAAAQTYGGSATGASITVPTTGTTIRAATGSVPISGGGAEAALLVGDIPSSATGGVAGLSAGVMHSSIVGTDATRAEASTADITLTVSSNTITADFIMARGTASCGPGVSGDSALPNLVINGQTITVTGNPNQTVTLPNGTATINEQTSSIAGTSAAITVNALHVITSDPITHAQLADVVLAQAAPQIDCQGAPATGTAGTGGGWVLSNDGANHSNFGVAGLVQPNGSYAGHIVFDDHLFGITIKSTMITFVDNSSVPCETTITATGEVNGNPVQDINVTIHDHGDPGTGRDTFTINATGYPGNAFTMLSGGNIQKHRETCTQ